MVCQHHGAAAGSASKIFVIRPAAAIPWLNSGWLGAVQIVFYRVSSRILQGSATYNECAVTPMACCRLALASYLRLLEYTGGSGYMYLEHALESLPNLTVLNTPQISIGTYNGCFRAVVQMQNLKWLSFSFFGEDAFPMVPTLADL